MLMNEDNIYGLFDMKEIILEIKENGDGKINIPKAFLTLLIEIEQLNEFNRFLMELIPMKYKKFNPRSGENPFFSKIDIRPPNEDIENAKERMRSLLERAKPKT